jgi:hypothetical protein
LRAAETPDYLKMSDDLDGFISFLVISYGVRGEFDPAYKSSIDYGGLDTF